MLHPLSPQGKQYKLYLFFLFFYLQDLSLEKRKKFDPGEFKKAKGIESKLYKMYRDMFI